MSHGAPEDVAVPVPSCDRLEGMSPLGATLSCTAGCLAVVLGVVLVSVAVVWVQGL